MIVQIERWLPLVLIAGLLLSCKTTSVPSQIKSTKDNSTAKSLLWKVDGKEKETSYVFGTIHLIHEDDYFFTQAMDDAFSRCSILALEFDLEDAMDIGSQMQLFQKAFMRGDTTLKDLLSEDDYKIVEMHFQKMGIPIFFLERVKPMFLTIFASEDLFGGGGLKMDELKSYELELLEKANSADMPVEGLETMEYQISIFDSIPYKVQADMLVESIEAPDDGGASLDTLIHYYKMQDLGKLDELINAESTTATYRTVLLDNRNINWIPVMEELMVRGSTYFAVGAGHLLGEFGVLQLLRNQGYQVTPVLDLTNGSDKDR